MAFRVPRRVRLLRRGLLAFDPLAGGDTDVEV